MVGGGTRVINSPCTAAYHSVWRRVFVVEFCTGRLPQMRWFHLCGPAGGTLLLFLLASHICQTCQTLTPEVKCVWPVGVHWQLEAMVESLHSCSPLSIRLTRLCHQKQFALPVHSLFCLSHFSVLQLSTRTIETSCCSFACFFKGYAQ